MDDNGLQPNTAAEDPHNHDGTTSLQISYNNLLNKPNVPVLPVSPANGGTGLSAGPTVNGQILIGSSGGTFTLNTLSAGTGITVTNSSSTITIAATGASVSLTAGENISSGDAVVVGDASNYLLESTSSELQNWQPGVANTDLISQRFHTSLHGNAIYSATCRYSSSSNDTVTCSVFSSNAGSGGSPSVQVGNSATASYTASANTTLTFTFSPSVTVNGDTDYHLVFSTNSVNGHFYTDGTAGTGTYVSTTANSHVYTTRNGPMYHAINEISTVAGKIYRTSTLYNNALANNFIGFASGAISNNVAGSVLIAQLYTTSGLTPGATQYLSDTFGAIQNNVGTVSRKIGIALSATQLLIKFDNP